jgi:VWFA-related protein
MRHLTSCVALALLCGGSLLSQAPPQEPPLVLRSTTRLVQVSVVAKDKSGRPVAGLQKEDFVITDAGKPQRIDSFSVDTKDQPHAPAGTLAPNVFSNRPEQGPEIPNNVTVILLDGLNTSWKDRKTGAEQLMRFLEQIQPGDRVAVYGLGRKLQILHDYTTDPASMLKAFAGYRRRQGAAIVSASQPTGNASPPVNAAEGELKERAIQGILEVTRGQGDLELRDRIRISLNAFESISNHLAAIPGRKNLVWVSAGFPMAIDHQRSIYPWMRPSRIPKSRGSAREPRSIDHLIYERETVWFADEVRRAVRALNDANVAVYPVDPRGISLATFASTEIATMKDLAKKTGGKAYYDRNDVMNAIREAVDDTSLTYTLSYYPSERKEDGQFRKIAVQVKRPGVRVRHRRGYVDLPSEPPQDEAARDAELRDVVWGPLDATAMRVEARLHLTNDPEPNTLALHVIAEPASVSLEQKDGRWAGKLRYVFVQTDEQGREYDITLRTMRLNLGPETYRETMKTGVPYRLTLPRKNGAEKLRIVVCDDASGRIGSVTIPFSRVAQDQGRPAN